jgi:CRISPR system Cascade subunit CasD
MNPDPVVTRRQYLVDARFGVILDGDRNLLERAEAALQNPVWGLWLGRKNCIPAQPVPRGLFDSASEAYRVLVGDVSANAYTTVSEVTTFAEGTDSLSDQPVSFGDGVSSGPDKRQFTVRRIRESTGSGVPVRG